MIPPRAENGGADVCPGCGQALVAVEASPAETEWYYEIDRKKLGPVTVSQLAGLVASGELTPASLVRRVEAAKWRRVRDVPELRPRQQTAAKLPKKVEGTFFARHKRRPYELIASLIVIVLVTIGYSIAASFGVPRPSGFLGHSLGILGFLMMLSAETLYSLRKQSKWIKTGRSSTWLQVHIFTGIVGPYLVLLHSAGKFQGLAGFVTLLVLLIVLSGFVGRYIYTAVPRTHDGAELTLKVLDEELADDTAELKRLGLSRLEAASLKAAMEGPPTGWKLVLGRPWLVWQKRRVIRHALAPLFDAHDEAAERMENLLMDRYRLMTIKESLPVARRLMAVWHLVHVPMGVVMFTLAFLHIAGALYYTSLTK